MQGRGKPQQGLGFCQTSLHLPPILTRRYSRLFARILSSASPSSCRTSASSSGEGTKITLQVRPLAKEVQQATRPARRRTLGLPPRGAELKGQEIEEFKPDVKVGGVGGSVRGASAGGFFDEEEGRPATCCPIVDRTL